MWFLKPAQKQVVKLNPDGTMVEYPMNIVGDNISAVQAGLPSIGPDGNIWFLSLEDGAHSYLNRINPDGSVNTFNLKTLDNQEATPYLSHTIELGPDGKFWIAMVRNFDEYYIAKYNTSGAVLDEIDIPAGQPAYNMKAGLSGYMWYARGDKIGKISSGGIVTEYDMPANNQPFAIELAQDGNIWFTAVDSSQTPKLAVGKITPEGTITMYPTEEPGNQPAWTLDLGPDGKLWFSLIGTGKVAVVSMDGSIFYHNFSPLVLITINKGPDNNMWALSYSAQSGVKVVKIFLGLTQEIIDEQTVSNNLLINPPSSPKSGATTVGIIVGALFVAVASLLFRYFGRDKTREKASAH
jgi:virginiamycin B lyase